MMSSVNSARRPVPPTAGPARMSRVYLAVWGLLAGFAILYLAMLALNPQMADQLVARRGDAGEDRRAQHLVAPLAAEMEALRRVTASLERDVESLRSDLARRDARDATIQSRLTALERQPTDAEAPLMQRASVPSTLDTQQLKGASVQGNIEERPAAPKARATEARTAAVAPDARQTSDTATTTAVPVAVHVASGPSVDALRLSWRLLQDKHRATLKSLEPRWVEIRGNPTVFALVAGPVSKTEDAAKICDRLSARRVPCTVVTFGGQPL